MLDLERHGFTPVFRAPLRVPMTTSRVIEPADATAVVHLATGFHIDEWRKVPGAVQVAYVDPRSPAAASRVRTAAR